MDANEQKYWQQGTTEGRKRRKWMRKLEIGARGAERLWKQRTTERRKAKEEMDRRELGL